MALEWLPALGRLSGIYLCEDSSAARKRAQEEESAHFALMKFGGNYSQNIFSSWPAVKPRKHEGSISYVLV
jgi:hypothetical protein